jgi:hypothetical protein
VSKAVACIFLGNQLAKRIKLAKTSEREGIKKDFSSDLALDLLMFCKLSVAFEVTLWILEVHFPIRNV